METKRATGDYLAAAEAVASAYDNDPDFAISMLQDLQRDFGHVPPEATKRIAQVLKIPVSQLYAIATFYSSLSLVPRGKHTITLCMGTVCYLKGARRIAQTIQERLKVGPGGTTGDLLFTFQPVNCLGACALAPVMVVDQTYFEKVKPDHIKGILAKYAAEGDSDSDGS